MVDMDNFIKIEQKDFNLKFVFDNLRNYGIAAALFYSGIVIFNNGASSTLLSFSYGGEIAGSILMLFALILATANFVQAILGFQKAYKWRVIPYVLITFIVHLVIFEVFFYRALHGV